MALRGAKAKGRQAAAQQVVRRSAPAAAMLMLLQACGDPFSPPESAEVRADAPASATGRRVRLVTASEFTSSGEVPPNVVLAHADTVELTLPFQREVEIQFHNGQQKLYVELSALEPGSAPVRLRVDIKDDNWYDRTLDLLEFRHRFVYTRG
jgi:hypothetical protein